MNDGYGIGSPGQHRHAPLQPPARWLVVIETGSGPLARLFLEDRTQVAELDASTEEVGQMTRGLQAQVGATGTEWDRALAGHDAAQRAAAQVYALDV